MRIKLQKKTNLKIKKKIAFTINGWGLFGSEGKEENKKSLEGFILRFLFLVRQIVVASQLVPVELFFYLRPKDFLRLLLLS